MRVIIASPPKSGNMWIKNLLAEIYQLQILEKDNPTDDPQSLKKHINDGWFADNAIFHEHYPPSNMFFELAESVNAHVVTTIRNPYDTFVSLYFYVQNFPYLFPASHPLHVLLGKPLDHLDVLDFIKRIEKGFGVHIMLAMHWLVRGHTNIVRYEKLHANTFLELKQLTSHIQPVTDEKIHKAIQASNMNNMRKMNKDLKKHIRKASVGDWRNHLSETHLELFREKYGQVIKEIGYEVA